MKKKNRMMEENEALLQAERRASNEVIEGFKTRFEETSKHCSTLIKELGLLKRMFADRETALIAKQKQLEDDLERTKEKASARERQSNQCIESLRARLTSTATKSQKDGLSPREDSRVSESDESDGEDTVQQRSPSFQPPKSRTDRTKIDRQSLSDESDADDYNSDAFDKRRAQHARMTAKKLSFRARPRHSYQH